MDKKKPARGLPDDLKGFEEFVEGQPSGSFMNRSGVAGNKKETNFENFTFLTTDGELLTKLKNLLNEKLPFAAKYEQGSILLKEQREEIVALQKNLFDLADRPNSAYRRSLEDVFDSYFAPTKI